MGAILELIAAAWRLVSGHKAEASGLDEDERLDIEAAEEDDEAAAEEEGE